MKISTTYELDWGEEIPYKVILKDGKRTGTGAEPRTNYEIRVEQINTMIPRLMIAHGSAVRFAINGEETMRIVAPHQIREVGYALSPETLTEACVLHEQMMKKLEALVAEHDAQQGAPP